MGKKIIIAIVGFAILAGIAFVAWWLYTTPQGSSSPVVATQGENNQSGTVQPASTVVGQSPDIGTLAVTDIPGAPQGNVFNIGTSEGLVTVNNVYHMPLVVDEEFLILRSTNEYQINYDSENSQFSIFFYSAGVGAQTRQAAETDFLSMLGVTQLDACKLNVGEQTAGDPIGKTAALSFCAASGGFNK